MADSSLSRIPPEHRPHLMTLLGRLLLMAFRNGVRTTAAGSAGTNVSPATEEEDA